MRRYQLYINGSFRDPQQGEWYDSYNPYTAQVWAEIPRGSAADMHSAIGAAHRARETGDWAKSTASERGRLLRSMGDIIAEHAEELATIEVTDNGKLYAEMHTQLKYLPEYYYYYGGLADKLQGAVIPIDKPGYLAFTVHEPLGVVGIITPWNSPLNLVTWKLAPALAAGNTVVIKPSEFASASMLELMALFHTLGIPPGVINVVTGFGGDVGGPLVEDARVAKIAFTGSDATGRRLYAAAAATTKRVSLELGGKSPNIVFDDADLDEAVNGVISGVFAASGQTCLAGSRALVQRSVHDRFVGELVRRVKAARLGDPMQASTQIGPIATLEQYHKVLAYINIALHEGAQLATGGAKPVEAPECGAGWFVEPTIFTGVRTDMRIAQEEVFGPVLSVLQFEDDEDAIRIANDTIYGLAAGVWTRDIQRAMSMVARLQAGTVWVNTYRTMSYMAPFGGYKQSGIGRENGMEAIMEYVQTKTVWLNTGAKSTNPFVQR